MVVRRRDPFKNFDKEFNDFDKDMKWMTAFIKIFFGAIALLIVGSIVWQVWITGQCYTSNDPHSTACYMMADTHVEVGITQR